MISKVKKLLSLTFAFFIVLSVTVFLINILHIVLENTTDIVTYILLVCAFCFILTSFVYDRVKIPARELIDTISSKSKNT